MIAAFRPPARDDDSARPARKVLAALDDSARAEGVLLRAVTMARLLDAEVFVLRAVDLPPSFPAAAATSVHVDPLAEHLRAQALDELGALVARFPDDRFGGPVVRAGEPWRVIVTLGRELDVDVIVIGSHGYGGLDRVLGTTAARVVDHADRDVLVARNPPSRS